MTTALERTVHVAPFITDEGPAEQIAYVQDILNKVGEELNEALYYEWAQQLDFAIDVLTIAFQTLTDNDFNPYDEL